MITVLSMIACILAMVTNWFLARGMLKIVYLLSIVHGSCFVVLNALLALSSNEQAGVAALIIPSAWMIVTSLLGLRRLQAAKGAKEQR